MKRVLTVLGILLALIACFGAYSIRQKIGSDASPTIWYFGGERSIIEKSVSLRSLAVVLESAFGEATREIDVDPNSGPAKQIMSRELGVGFVPTIWLIGEGKQLGLEPLYWLPPPQGNALVIVVMKGAPMRVVADLRGKKGGVPSHLQSFAETMLSAAGLDPKQSFSSLELIPSTRKAAPGQEGPGVEPVPPLQFIKELTSGAYDFLILPLSLLQGFGELLESARVLHQGPPLPAVPESAVVVSVNSGPELAAELAKGLPPEIVSKYTVKNPEDFAPELHAFEGALGPLSPPVPGNPEAVGPGSQGAQ